MPIIQKSTYEAKGIFRNHHLNTMHAGLFRKVAQIPYKRERLNTHDQDFIDIDYVFENRNKAIILLHGLEGRSNRPYMLGMAQYFLAKGWDIIAMNFRGCSGEPNKLPRSYHIGETNDLHTVIQHTIKRFHHAHISLLGFSVGGNVVLKYLGERANKISPEIKSAIAISTPVHVVSANREIDRWYNWHYRKNLVASLNEKYRQKMSMFPELFSQPEFGWPVSFEDYDGLYTAPVHGFASAYEYWDLNSSIHFIPDIQIPTLLINSLDDTFLSSECYPKQLADQHEHFHLEVTKYGGHLGFVSSNPDGSYWTEQRSYEFSSQFDSL